MAQPARSLKILACAVLFVLGATSALGATAKSAAAGVAWRPFDAEVLAEAKRDGKLVLLWIHAPWGVLDRMMVETTFTDEKVVSLINAKLLAVKVDLLERPDLYARYGGDGWPTTTFLLPTGRPVYYLDATSGKMAQAGGHYYGPDDLLAYLTTLLENYESGKEESLRVAGRIEEGILARKEVGDAPLKPELLEASVTRVLDTYRDWRPDPTLEESHLPDPDSAALAFHYHARKAERQVIDVILSVMTEMARGGIRDHLGGGFHRAALDAAWRVPSFEKLLSVNAGLLEAYTDVFRLTGNGRYRPIAEGIADYVLGALTDPSGWHYAYQAGGDGPGDEGLYYTWTLEEARAALTEEEQRIVLPAYDIGEWGELTKTAPRRNVLYLREGEILLSRRLGVEEDKVAETLAASRRKLLEARSRRKAPPVGKVLVTDAAAAMAGALVRAGDLLRRDDLREAGLKSLQVLWEKAWDPAAGRLDHLWTPESGRAALTFFFADHAEAARALLIAYESTGSNAHLHRARQVADAAAAAFADSLDGGFSDRTFSADLPGLLSWPVRSLRDNALFAETLIRLHVHTGEAGYLKTARKTLESWADEFGSHGALAARFGLSVDRYLNPPLEVIVLGSGGEPGFEAVQAKARALYHPWSIIRYLARDAARSLATRQVTPPDGPACVLCLGERCSPPYGPEENLRERQAEFLQAPAAERP